jgi:hypothetical protein
LSGSIVEQDDRLGCHLIDDTRVGGPGFIIAALLMLPPVAMVSNGNRINGHPLIKRLLVLADFL